MVDRADHEHLGEVVMEPVRFIDPFAVEKPASTERVPKPAPMSGPAAGPPAAVLSSSQGREREVQRLIHDLAVLTTRQQPGG